MSLGPAAYTVASHAAILAALLLAHWRVQQLRWDAGDRYLFIVGRVTPWAAFAVVSALLVERIYFVAARLLLPHGVDLFQLHPAPGALSILLAASLWSVSVAKHLSTLTPGYARRAIAMEAVGLMGLWALVAAVLH